MMQIDDTGNVKYRRKEKSNMKLTDWIISPETLGDKLLLIDVRPAYQYVNGKPTETIIGYRYVIALPAKMMEKISVKIDGNKLMDVPSAPLEVMFEELELYLFFMNGQPRLGGRAKNILPVNKG